MQRVRCIDIFYSLTVEAGFYGDVGRVIGIFLRKATYFAVSTWLCGRDA